MYLILEEVGYDVATVSSGLEALNYVCQNSVPDLLITDLDMPDITGTELIHDMSILFPQLSFIVISGYGIDEIDSIQPNKNCIAYIHKPYNEKTLVKTVANFLSEKGKSPAEISTEYRPAIYA